MCHHRARREFCITAVFTCTQGFDAARIATVAFLETFRQAVARGDREMLLMVARTSLRTKLAEVLADQLTAIVADAVLTIQKPDEPIDLYMVRARMPWQCGLLCLRLYLLLRSSCSATAAASA